MGNNSKLMFQIGIQEIGKKLPELQAEITNLVTNNGKGAYKIKVELDGATELLNQLKNLGNVDIDAFKNKINLYEKQIKELQLALKTALGLKKEFTKSENVNVSSWNPSRKLTDAISKEFENAAKTAENSKQRVQDAIDSLKRSLDSIQLGRAKGLKAGVDISGTGTIVNEIKSMISELERMLGNSRQMGNSGFIEKIIAQYRELYDRIAQGEGRVNGLMGKGTGAASANATAKNEAASATKRLTIEEEQLVNSIRKGISAYHTQIDILGDLKSLAKQYLGVWGGQQFLNNVIQIGGQLELQRLSIGAILGDMAKATELFDRIKNLAIKSPFGVVELDQMTKQLTAYGFQYNELFDMTKRLADISAATGTGVDRLALALGHVRSEAALSGYTLRQFSMANIPLAKKLSEHLSEVEGKFVSIAEVRKRVRAKDIGYEEVEKVLKDLTNEGGMFYNAQEVMSQSVKARFKNLKDSMDIMYGEIAESSVGGALKEVAKILTTMTRHWEELGSVLMVGAGYWAINRVAMTAVSKAAFASNVVTGQLTAKQIEAQAATGNLTREQLLLIMTTKKLSATDVEAAANTLGLARAQLIHARNTGNVTAALNMATISTSKYSIAQLRLMAMLRNIKLFNMKDFFMGIASGAKAAGTALLGMAKTFVPLLAISAVVEIFMSMKRETEEFADAANYVGQSARQMIGDINNAIKSVTKNGKPVDTDSLREAINSMREIVQQSEFYTDEQQKQVDNAKSLSQKYDILLKQMKEMREEAQWQADSEGLFNKVLANTGKSVVEVETPEFGTTKSFGLGLFNDSLQENLTQLNSHNSELNTAISMLSEYQDVMNTAIEKNNGFGLSLDGKGWQEQIRIIAESGHWDEFVASVEHAGSRFNTTAENVKKASESVRDDWDEIVNDDFEAIKLSLMDHFNFTEKELNEWAKRNQNLVKWFVDGIIKAMSKLGFAETLLENLKSKLLNFFDFTGGGKKPENNKPSEYDLQTDLGKRILGNIIRYNKKNGKGNEYNMSVKDVNGLTGTGDKALDESEVLKKIKENAQKSYQTMKDTERIWGESSKQYVEAKKKYDKNLNIALANNITEDEIKTGKYKDKKNTGSKVDLNEKDVRERIRIMKEVADSFQYWREKVGDVSALDHVNAEYGDVLEKIDMSIEDVKDLRGNLNSLTPLIAKIKDKKVRDESYKEQAKELADLDRKDFEKATDEYLKNTKLQLENLTRAWDKFNTVRDATGSIDIAIQISGANYGKNGQYNLADAIQKYIKDELAKINVEPIVFDVNIDEKSLEESIWAAFENNKPIRAEGESNDAYNKRLSEYQDKIKAIINLYKEWQKEQRDVETNDMKVFTEALNDEYDRQQQLDKVISQYENSKRSLDNLLRQWYSGAVDKNGNRLGITKEQYDLALGRVTNKSNWEKFKADNNFKWVFENINTVGIETIRKMVDAMRDYAKNTEMGVEETQALNEALDKLTDQESILEPTKSIVNTIGLYKDAVANRKSAEEALRIAKMPYAERKRQGIDESTVKPVDKADKDLTIAINNQRIAWIRASKAVSSFANNLSDLGSALSSLGNAIGGDFGSIMGGFGSMIGTFGSSLQTISQMKDVKGIEGVIGNVSSVLSVASAGIEMNKQLAETLPYTENIYDKYAEKQREINQLTDAINSYSKAVTEARWNEHGWISDDPLTNLSKQFEIHGDAAYAYFSKLNEYQEKYVEKSGMLAKSVLPVLGAVGGAIAGTVLTIVSGGTAAVVAAGLLAGAAVGAGTGQAKQAQIDSLMYDSNLVHARENMQALTQHRSFWRGEKTQNLEEWVRENIKDRYGMAAELFDEEGLINLETAQAVLDSGQRLAGETEDTLKKLMELRKDYDEWEKSVEEYVSSKFSPLADNMVDAIWDWLANGEDALDKFHEYASKTFMDIAKDAVKSFLKITVLDKYEDMLKELYKSYSSTDGNGNRQMSEKELMRNVASIAGSMATSFESVLPVAEELGKTITEMFEGYGYDVANGGSSSSVSSTGTSIKSVSEQTADLLASYLNAVRADVSVNRAMISEYFPMYYKALTSSSNSLNNIESHTDAIMRSNDTIAAKITSLDNNINGLKNKAWKMPIAAMSS